MNKPFSLPSRPLYIKLCPNQDRFKRLLAIAKYFDTNFLETVYILLDEKISEVIKLNSIPVDKTS